MHRRTVKRKVLDAHRVTEEREVADLDVEALARAPGQLSEDRAVPAPATQFAYSRSRRMRPALAVAGSMVFGAALIVGFGYTFSSSRWLWGAWFETAAPVVVQAEGPPLVSGQPVREADEKASQSDTAPQGENTTAVADREASTRGVTVVVERRQTLRQICLRNVGRYNDSLVGEIRELNPWMSDPNHLEVGQRVQLPLPTRQHFEGKPKAGSIVDRESKPVEKP